MRFTPSLVAALLFAAAAAPSFAQYPWCANSDRFWVDVIDSTIVVHHDLAVYNCCPDPFEYSVRQEGGTIHVTETEVLTHGCFCLCCYNLSVTIEHVGPGDYTIDFYYFEYDTQAWRHELIPVTVPPVGQLGAVSLGPSAASECLDEAVSVPEGQIGATLRVTRWGVIKAQYR